MLTKDTVRPSNIRVEEAFMDSSFQNSEKETIARNTVLLSQWNGDQWMDFTWEEYRQKCKHSVTEAERAILNDFVRSGLLSCVDGVYSVRDAFIQALAKFVVLAT